MPSDEFLGVKRACREAGKSGSYARVYRAIRSGDYSGEVAEGSRGMLVRASEVAEFLDGADGAANGAGTGAAPVRTGAPAPKRTKSAPMRTAPPTPVRSASASVQTLRDEVELRRLQQSLTNFDERERGDAARRGERASLEAERQRRQWQREDAERERSRRERDRAAWAQRWYAEAVTRAVRLAGPREAAELESSIRPAVDAALGRLWSDVEAAQPDESATARAVADAVDMVVGPLIEARETEELARRWKKMADAAAATRLGWLNGFPTEMIAAVRRTLERAAAAVVEDLVDARAGGIDFSEDSVVREAIDARVGAAFVPFLAAMRDAAEKRQHGRKRRKSREELALLVMMSRW